jgi:hypothetical protein
VYNIIEIPVLIETNAEIINPYNLEEEKFLPQESIQLQIL